MFKRPVLRMMSLIISLIFLFSVSHAAYAAGTVTGTVFRDYNLNSVQDGTEPGISGITVTAFDSSGGSVGVAFSGVGGAYSLNWVGAETSVRIEFTTPTGFQPGTVGAGSGSTVQFVTNGAIANAGIIRVGDFCQAVPDLATNCYVQGTQTTGDAVIVSFPNNAGSTVAPWSAPAVDLPAHPAEATALQVGTTWGLGYEGMTDSLFAGAFMKRHAGFGPGGPGAIYRINRALPIAAPGHATLFVTIPNAGVDPHAVADPTLTIDAASFDQVGKMSLGDVDVADDGLALFAMNLADRSLYQVPLTITPAGPIAGIPVGFPVPNPCANPADMRPFGIGYFEGLVYAGVVCSAESTQAQADLSAHVFVMTPGVGFGGSVLSFSLAPVSYPRGCAMRRGPVGIPPVVPPAPTQCASAQWNAWSPTFTSITTPFFSSDPFEHVYPQPILSDIEFDANGDMVIGFRDRFGDQQGFYVPSPAGGAQLFSADVAGDVLRACRAGAGWVLENNAMCGAVTTIGAGTNQGPGGGEFYRLDGYPLHDETSQGGLVIVPGQTDVVMTAYDVVFDENDPFDGGILWLSNTTGLRSRSYRVFDATAVPGAPRLFGKGGGLGDLDVLCQAAPIEIGNRVWIDTDYDGVQDPNETPLANIVVELYDALGNLLGTTTTDANGNYLFSSAPGIDTPSTDYGVPGLTFFTLGYQVRISMTQPALAGYTVTQGNVSSDGQDNRDSDGILSGSTTLTTFGTGGAGANNHTYDFGFFFGTPPVIPPTGGTGGTGGAGSPSASVPSIAKSVNPPFAQNGDLVTWTITVANPTNAPLANVTTTDTIPADLVVLSASSNVGTATISGQVVTFNANPLAANTTAIITIRTRLQVDSDTPVAIRNVAVLQAPYSGTATADLLRVSVLPTTGETPSRARQAWERGSWALLGAILLLWLRRRTV